MSDVIKRLIIRFLSRRGNFCLDGVSVIACDYDCAKEITPILEKHRAVQKALDEIIGDHDDRQG